VVDLTLFKALTGGAFDRLNWQMIAQMIGFHLKLSSSFIAFPRAVVLLQAPTFQNVKQIYKE